MIKTQVYLDDHQPKIIKVVAESSKRSQSEVIREALERGLRQMQSEKAGNADGLVALAELGEKMNIKAPADLSARIDDYLYGEED
jgi:hypothetical protein